MSVDKDAHQRETIKKWPIWLGLKQIRHTLLIPETWISDKTLKRLEIQI